MISLENKVVLITGGSRGIGEACVRLFALANAEIAFTYRNNSERAEKVIKDASMINPTIKIKAYKCEQQNEMEIIDTVTEIKKEFGRIDVLVNNAGIWKYGEVERMSLEEWNDTMAINMTAYFLFCREVIPLMKQRKDGKIVLVSSTAGQRGEAFHSHYAASKGAAISFVKSLSVELGQFNINVNCVAPGWVNTEMCDGVFEDLEFREGVRMSIPLGRIPNPDDIAGPILFLASDLARHITGEVLNVNGGSVLCG